MLQFLLILSASAACVMSARSLVHYFQLESYQFPGYFRTVYRNLVRCLIPGCCIAVWLLIAGLLLNVNRIFFVILCIIVVLVGFVLSRRMAVQKAKKPLAFTARIKRLYAMMSLSFAAIAWSLTAVHPAAVSVLGLLLPYWLALAGLLAWPVEKLISEMYFRDAQRILRSRKDLIRIGITGSYGKTSVKFILGTLLQ